MDTVAMPLKEKQWVPDVWSLGSMLTPDLQGTSTPATCHALPVPNQCKTEAKPKKPSMVETVSREATACLRK
jgi:hypothetical protein